jgi:serine/threonine protein kinase
MTSRDGDSDRDDSIETPILPLMDQQWEAKKCGKPMSPDQWQKLHPDGAGGLADMRLLDALYDAACAINEDSQLLHVDPREDTPNDSAKAVDQNQSTVPYISNNPSLSEDKTTIPIVGIREGDKIGKFEIKEVLGRGGQAHTYKAWDPDTERTVVVKAYHGAAREGLEDAVVQEGQKLTKVQSPYVIQCYHVERWNGIPYLVLEYVPGKSLAESQASKPLSIAESLTLIGKVAKGLAAVHARGVLHRDIKPGNIIVGPNRFPKLVDFGLAKPVGDPGLGNVAGTFSYMAPEQARGDMDHVDQRTDIFGIGATLYYLLTNHAPYEGSPTDVRRAAREGDVVAPRQLNPKVPADVNRLCLRCLAKAPDDRFESATALARVIDRRPMRRMMTYAGTVAAILILVAIVASRFSQNDSIKASATNATSPQGAATETTRIESVDFLQYVRTVEGRDEYRGIVLKAPYVLREGDKVRFMATLSRQAYCYWISFQPDGVDHICFPDDPDVPPQLTNVPSYPILQDDDVAYALTDGIGFQVFVLVVSDDRLPSYNDWKKALPKCPWGRTGESDGAIHHHDGEQDHVIPLERGPGASLRTSKGPLDDLVAWIRGAANPPPIVDAWALPVLPRGEQKPPTVLPKLNEAHSAQGG